MSPAAKIPGAVLISVTDQDKPAALEVAREFARLGFKIRTTLGTHRYLAEHGLASEVIKKLQEGRPNIVDAITNKEIHLVINTPIGKLSQHDDSYIRKAAIKHRVPYITTLAAAAAAVRGIAERRQSTTPVRSLQSYHADIGN